MTVKFIVNTNPHPVTIEFEVGSIKEGLAILQENESELSALYAESAGQEAAETGSNEPKRRGRPRKSEQKAETPEAPVAPPPPVAAAPAPIAPPNTTPGENGIPAFLQRSPAPVAPPPPPVPAAPAAERLADKVVRKLKEMAGQSPDGGKSLADWLASAGTVVPGASFDEAIAVVELQKDETLAPIATALQI